ncbi:hypothetical protein AVEN_105785-1 [Araneus ventricosus]|uniref:Uncharacterized protein n=1 Tax=Araneus ventricosus TaxID=182803 RepID=A0A4Y2G2B6_ARAVE|nr:hypothetical protein AVEN_105785-1 [Araneus ventricosus]
MPAASEVGAGVPWPIIKLSTAHRLGTADIKYIKVSNRRLPTEERLLERTHASFESYSGPDGTTHHRAQQGKAATALNNLSLDTCPVASRSYAQSHLQER